MNICTGNLSFSKAWCWAVFAVSQSLYYIIAYHIMLLRDQYLHHIIDHCNQRRIVLVDTMLLFSNCVFIKFHTNLLTHFYRHILSYSSTQHNSTQAHSNINLVGLDIKVTLQTPHHQTNSMLILSQLLPIKKIRKFLMDFDTKITYFKDVISKKCRKA